jgi:hypothetical protein
MWPRAAVWRPIAQGIQWVWTVRGSNRGCGRDFPQPSRPATGSTQLSIQWLAVLYRGLSSRIVALTTHSHLVWETNVSEETADVFLALNTNRQADSFEMLLLICQTLGRHGPEYRNFFLEKLIRKSVRPWTFRSVFNRTNCLSLSTGRVNQPTHAISVWVFQFNILFLSQQ